MFGRFTTEARAVVAAGQDEARAWRAGTIEPVHLLLSLTGDPGRAGRALRAAGAGHDDLAEAVARVGGLLDAEALAAVGIDLDQVRAATEAAFGPGALDSGARSPDGHIPFADTAKRALAEAVQLAAGTRAGRIDGAHLLFGLLSVGDGAVDRVLRQVGADPEELRRSMAAAG